MKRRDFIALGSAVGLSSTVLPLKLFSASGPPATPTEVDGRLGRYKEIQAQIVSVDGRINIRHSKFISPSDLQPRSMFNGSVLEFRTDGNVVFSNGRRLSGKKGAKFKLFVFRDRQTNLVKRRVLAPALSRDEFVSLRALKTKKVSL